MKVILDDANAAPVLRSMAPQPKKRIRAALRQLGEDPLCRDNGLDCKRLDAEPGVPIYRVRIGDWRVAYTVDTEVVVLPIFARAEGYGWVADMD